MIMLVMPACATHSHMCEWIHIHSHITHFQAFLFTNVTKTVGIIEIGIITSISFMFLSCILYLLNWRTEGIFVKLLHKNPLVPVLFCFCQLLITLAWLCLSWHLQVKSYSLSLSASTHPTGCTKGGKRRSNVKHTMSRAKLWQQHLINTNWPRDIKSDICIFSITSKWMKRSYQQLVLWRLSRPQHTVEKKKIDPQQTQAHVSKQSLEWGHV